SFPTRRSSDLRSSRAPAELTELATPQAMLRLLAMPMIRPVLPSKSRIIGGSHYHSDRVVSMLQSPTDRSVGLLAGLFIGMEQLPTFTFEIVVENRFGVLFNITGLF